MNRSAVSIPSNIAEGYGRATTQDYLHFLRIARGSAYELETQLVLAQDLGLCTEERGLRVQVVLQEEIRILQGLIAALERKIEKTGWLIDGPNIPGRPFWVMRHRTPLLT